MASPRLYVIDTSCIIATLSTKPSEKALRETTVQHIAKVVGDGGRIIVPAPAVAELAEGLVGEAAIEALGALVVGLQVIAFNVEMGTLAAKMRAARLAAFKAANPSGGPPFGRGAVLFDTLIAATAAHKAAAAILTANERDFVGALASVGSAMPVVNTRTAPPGTDLPLFPNLAGANKKRKKPPEPPAK